jgi:hypothetical protein
MSLKDPVHFFNARGLSVLTQENQETRIKELEAEIKRLNELLTTAMGRLERNSETENSANRVLH